MSMMGIKPKEVESLYEYIDYNFIETIRKDNDLDNMEYIYNIMNIWKRCKDIIEKEY